MITGKKIITLGERSSGKTSLIYRFVEGKFKSTQASIGCNYSSKNLESNDSIINLKFYDTAGQEIYHSIAKVYFNGCDAVTLVYRKDSIKTFESLDFWLNKLREFLSENIPVYVVCSHCDVKQGDLVSNELGIKFCEDNKLKGFFQVSSYTGEGVLELYTQILEDLLKCRYVRGPSFELNESKKEVSKKSCKC